MTYNNVFADLYDAGTVVSGYTDTYADPYSTDIQFSTVARPIWEFDGSYLRSRNDHAIPYGSNPPPPPPPPPAPYRPLSLTWTNGLSNAAQITSLNSQGVHTTPHGQGCTGVHIPTDVNLVLWPYSNPDGARLNVWLESLGANDVGVLPEAVRADGSQRPYQVESANGFKRDATYFFSMCNMKRGILGLGPNTLITTSASSYTQGQQANPYIDPTDSTKSYVGNPFKVFSCSTVNSYLGNFEVQGRSFGGVAYNCFAFNKGIGVLESIYFNDCHRGFRNSPNGETGAWTSQKGAITWARNFEVECRDSTGARNASSPFMLNNMSAGMGCLIEDYYVHHSVAGMPTAYNCVSTPAAPMIYRRMRSEYNGSGGGSLNGSCHNWELCSGVIEFQGPGTLICNYNGTTDPTQGSGNTEFHMSGGSNQARATINVRNVAIDKGPRPRTGTGTPQTDANGLHVLAYQLFGYTTGIGQQGLDIHYFAPSGAEISTYQYGTLAP